MEDFSTKHFIVFDFIAIGAVAKVALGLANGINLDGEPWSLPVILSDQPLGEGVIRHALSKIQGRTISKDVWAQTVKELEGIKNDLDGEFLDVFGHKTFKATELGALL